MFNGPIRWLGDIAVRKCRMCLFLELNELTMKIVPNYRITAQNIIIIFGKGV
jgi:hypothetical protein